MKAVMRPRHHAREEGFTIFETMVACVMLLGGMAATLALITQAGATTVKTRSREQATNLQRELVEAARSIPYDQLTPTGIGAAVRGRPALGDSSVSQTGWTIRRRGTTYTISLGVCTVDDPGDGTGAHDAGVFCASTANQPTASQCDVLIKATLAAGGVSPTASSDPNAGPCGIDTNLDGTVDGLASRTATTCGVGGACSSTPDANPADYKRVVALVRWKGGYNLQTSQLNNPGLAAAPAVSTLTPASTSVTSTQTSLAIAATATNTPATVGLYLDGTYMAAASSGGGTAWNGTWTLGPVSPAGSQPADDETLDGSYQVSAKAFDQYGQYGSTKTQVVVLDRRLAFAPAHVGAGRNGAVVEIEWSPAKERDSVGFTVERRVGSAAPVVVCALTLTTRCQDQDPPPASAAPTYSVVGYDTGPDGQPRAGDRSSEHAVDPAKDAPGVPTALQATKLGNDVKLTWAAPASGTVPDHYNIYRDGQSYDNRLDSVYFKAGDALTYTDTRTTRLNHTYYVTAVNDELGESLRVGPVG